MSFLGLDAYELVKEQELNDIHSKGYVLRHKKSGARVALVSNDDDNKVFCISFRTTPQDKTGVPHIIEHSVLCGSDKFPVKDPFVELVKGSLNTFLNAMTYPDKTMYPVASYNNQDFKNLMDVYLDAVFHPNILKYEEIFKQEGWHYELEDKDAELTINGVVYNEMKGAYSSPEELLQSNLFEAMFPDTTYGMDSGGNPDYIPELTYEKFLEFYKTYYHPSNSYIYLYGDFDIEERLDWMDKAYLSHYDVLEVNTGITMQEDYGKVKEVVSTYTISSEESEEDNTYLAYSKVVSTSSDKVLNLAFSVLDYCLISAPGAPVRKALIEAGIGKDVYGAFDDGILQPTFGICSKNANASDKERFVNIIEDTMRQVIKEGVKESSILAALNSTEFRFREADYGQFPRGLLYGLNMMSTWLYDDAQVFDQLEILDIFQELREKAGTGYYEELIQKYLLDNTHGVVVTLKPEKGLAGKNEEALKEKLASYKATLTDEELEQLITDHHRLKEYQDEVSSEEDLKKIPMLERKDMRKEVSPYYNEERTIGEVPVLLHNMETNGIDYVTLLFDAEDVSIEDLPYLSILRSMFGYMDTEYHSYAELSNDINIHTGGVGCGLNAYPEAGEKVNPHVRFEFKVRVLENKLEKAFELLREIILTTQIADQKRLVEIIAQSKSRIESMLSNSGNMVSATRSMAYFSEYAFYQDVTMGIGFYEAICKMDDMIKKEPDMLIARLRKVANQVIAKNRLMISFTGTEVAYEEAIPVLEGFIGILKEGAPKGEVVGATLGKKNEGFTDASAIQYVSRTGSFAKHGYKYTGYFHVLKMILSYDYLWMNVRVKGGAYGCSSTFYRTGEVLFSSYRDPNLRKTNEVYEAIPEYLRQFSADEREMTKYIIGTLGAIDTPMNPEAKGNRSLTAYLKKLTETEIQRERDEILSATQEDIRGLADVLEAVLSDGNFCVIGNENIIRSEQDMFMEIKSLLD